jgi:hypothetical protein
MVQLAQYEFVFFCFQSTQEEIEELTTRDLQHHGQTDVLQHQQHFPQQVHNQLQLQHQIPAQQLPHQSDHRTARITKTLDFGPELQ